MPTRLTLFLRFWPVIASLGGGLVFVGGYGAYAAITDHNSIAANTHRIEALEAAIPKMQTDIQVICWTVAGGQGCSAR